MRIQIQVEFPEKLEGNFWKFPSFMLEKQKHVGWGGFYYLTEFAKQLADLMQGRGIRSDEQLARRATGCQTPGTRRINVHARTINNWRNGRSRPRSSEDPRLLLVMKALALSEAEAGALHECLTSPKANEGSSQRSSFTLNPRNLSLQKQLAAAAIFTAFLGAALFSVHGLNASKREYVSEIPPDQLRLSKSGFVLPQSDNQVIRQAQLEELSGWELYVARNEIFARYGRPFVQPSSVCLQRHFDRWAKSEANQAGWYVKRSGSPLASDLAYTNAAVIRGYECQVRGGQYTCNGKLNLCR
ncbi:hypothetical protein A33O_05130 [Nitratireductor aquibiodomus RA22]|uniref:YARHG domain-containing protein n=1 Tax=Nitratireductor aquibiodomus RA22 TaxID=1189611 RepID=I5C3X9_9HYPH|nr:YARHG domain-containing protein [Nitratireductor aquibiodomus]EIM76531.1 hypothetical protein A33O_05130 [Nitratireductor aquibiodomus RA22]